MGLQLFGQYMLVAGAIVILLLLKYYTINKSYKNKLSAYIEPSLLTDEIRSKLKKHPQSDTTVLLSHSLTGLKQDPTRIRNIAILICLMQEDKVNLDPFANRINQTLAQIEWAALPAYCSKYRDYIQKQFKKE